MSGKGAVGLDECMPEILNMVKEDVLDCWSLEGGWICSKTTVISLADKTSWLRS